MKKPIDVVLIGAGNRGRDVYGRYIRRHPEQFRLLAVADPAVVRREKVAQQLRLPAERQFATWEELLQKPQMAQAAIIATPDQNHTRPALAALEAGYDVLLEKPMAIRQEDCVRLVQVSEEQGRLLQISHVLRYTPVMQKVKQILESGKLGELITVSHRENVSFWHMAHSYVRGNWRNAQEASPMILAKCSHDFDLLYWFLERQCTHLSSIGTLLHFHSEQAPQNGPERCTDGCPIADSCPYEATNIYLDLQPFMNELKQTKHPIYSTIGRFAASKIGQLGLHSLSRFVPPLRMVRDYHGWPRSVISEQPGEAAILHALESGPYGRCVYRCDNNVVDHQVVSMQFEGGMSVTLTMHGHSHQEGRTLRIDGTLSTLFARMNLFESEIEVHHKRSRKVERSYMPHAYGQGHGGGDDGLMNAFYQALTDHQQPPLTSARASLESHLLAFAAEQARLNEKVIHMQTYRANAWANLRAEDSVALPETRPEQITNGPVSQPTDN